MKMKNKYNSNFLIVGERSDQKRKKKLTTLVVGSLWLAMLLVCFLVS
jgi:hypothetical protein